MGSDPLIDEPVEHSVTQQETIVAGMKIRRRRLICLRKEDKKGGYNECGGPDDL